MIFCADRIGACGYPHAVVFDADGWRMAERICEDEGWILRGELVATIDDPEFSDIDADAMIAILDEASETRKH